MFAYAPRLRHTATSFPGNDIRKGDKMAFLKRLFLVRLHYSGRQCKYIALVTGVLAGLFFSTAAFAQTRLARHLDTTPPKRIIPAVPLFAPDSLLVRQDRKVAMAADVYALWNRQLTGAVLSSDSLRSWQQFLGMDITYPAAARQLGMEAYDVGDFFNAAALLAIAYDFNPDDVELRGFLAFAYKESGRYEKALELLKLAIIEEPDSFLFWWWLGDTQRLLGNYDQALECMLTAAELAPPDQEDSFHEYVDYTRSLASNTANWDTFEIHRDFAQRHERQRRTRRAIAEYITALDLAPEILEGDLRSFMRLGWTYQQIGLQYTYVKEPDIAIDYYIEALRFYEKAQSSDNVMRNHQNLALAYVQLAEISPARRKEYFETAISYWGEALRLAKNLDDPAYLRYARGAQLALYARIDPIDSTRLTELREMLTNEIPWRGPIEDYTVAEVVLGEAACRMKEGDWAGARTAIEMVLPYYDGTRYLTDLERTAGLNVFLAKIYHEQGHPAQSLRYAEDAKAKLESVREFVDMDAFNRSPNRALLRQIYAASARAALKRNQPERALEHIEHYQTQLRRDLLGTKMSDQSISTDPEAETELIRRRIPLLEERLERARSGGNAPEVERLELRLHRDQARLDWLELGVRFAPASRLSLCPVETQPIESIMAAIPENAALLSYILDPWGATVTITTRDGVQGQTLDEATEDIVEVLVRTVLRSPADSTEALQTLYDLLIAPLRSLLPEGLIYIAPDEVLSRLPFEMLGPADRPLLDEFCMAYTASGSHLARTLEQHPSPELNRLLALSAPAPVLESAKTAFAEVTSRGTANLSARNLIEDVLPGDYLHWTIGTDFGQEDAMICALVTPEEGKAGRLHAADFLFSTLPAAAVVIDASRIESEAPGSMAIEAFEEALFHSGTPAMLVNLWDTPPDSSARIMAAFYRNLATMNKAEALSAAKREFRQEDPASTAWAAYILRGDYR